MNLPKKPRKKVSVPREVFISAIDESAILKIGGSKVSVPREVFISAIVSFFIGCTFNYSLSTPRGFHFSDRILSKKVVDILGLSTPRGFHFSDSFLGAKCQRQLAVSVPREVFISAIVRRSSNIARRHNSLSTPRGFHFSDSLMSQSLRLVTTSQYPERFSFQR